MLSFHSLKKKPRRAILKQSKKVDASSRMETTSLFTHQKVPRELNGCMKAILQFNITQDDNVYTAEGVNASIVTEARTFEELQDNIRDAVALYFEGDDPASLGFDKSPAILTNFEVSPSMHAGRT